MLSIPFMPL